jgi:hypothetical protein
MASSLLCGFALVGVASFACSSFLPSCRPHRQRIGGCPGSSGLHCHPGQCHGCNGLYLGAEVDTQHHKLPRLAFFKRSNARYISMRLFFLFLLTQSAG